MELEQLVSCLEQQVMQASEKAENFKELAGTCLSYVDQISPDMQNLIELSRNAKSGVDPFSDFEHPT